MYIDFEITDTDMIFTRCQEDGTVISTDTYSLEDFIPVPNDGGFPSAIVVRPIGEFKGSWPPKASYPLDRIVFINSTSPTYYPINNYDAGI